MAIQLDLRVHCGASDKSEGNSQDPRIALEGESLGATERRAAQQEETEERDSS